MYRTFQGYCIRISDFRDQKLARANLIVRVFNWDLYQSHLKCEMVLDQGAAGHFRRLLNTH
jgi:hypothetical protein